jgi:hypothetical protein
MDIAALLGRLGEHLHDGALEAGMIVADSEDDSPQSASFSGPEGTLPTRRTLPIGHLHAQHLAPAFPINPNGHQHGPGADHSVFPQLFIARIDNQIGIFALQLSPREAS